MPVLPEYDSQPVTEWQRRLFSTMRKMGLRVDVTLAGPDSMQVTVKYMVTFSPPFLAALARSNISVGMHIEDRSTFLFTFTKV